ncbi:hypothetical protein NE237_028192 [Protea cynaroides]|uniref:Uncharacterized protein n=1 Tax=Protea cynaroides TaxID=273540 RepID=A0A9Q0GPU0_9MAGN|nr:hypothetical protein NE237_028192 [Protea cynaroides]
MEHQPSEENDRGGRRPARPQGGRRPGNTISQRSSVAFTAAIPAPRSSDGDGTAISFSVYKTTYAPAPTSGSAHHTFGLAHQYKAAASASPCFRTSYSSASARSTESTTIGYSMAYVYGTGREAGIGRRLVKMDSDLRLDGSTAGETTSLLLAFNLDLPTVNLQEALQPQLTWPIFLIR